MVRKQSPYEDVQKQLRQHDPYKIIEPTPKKYLEGSAYEVIYNHLSYKHEVLDKYIETNTAVFWIKKDDIFSVATTLRHLGYECLSEMSAVDLCAKKGYFELFYQFVGFSDSCKNRRRVRVKCILLPNESVDSLSFLYRSANWSEREAYDMLGIVFDKHPYLKRLIMPHDWVGHPLLRSYPLKGDEFAQWYEVDKIFGKEYREVVGKEQRDSARVDEKDTFNFAKIGYEQGKGEELKETEEKHAFKKIPFVKDLHKIAPTILKKRL